MFAKMDVLFPVAYATKKAQFDNLLIVFEIGVVIQKRLGNNARHPE
jgi:hypothetical protein